MEQQKSPGDVARGLIARTTGQWSCGPSWIEYTIPDDRHSLAQPDSAIACDGRPAGLLPPTLEALSDRIPLNSLSDEGFHVRIEGESTGCVAWPLSPCQYANWPEEGENGAKNRKFRPNIRQKLANIRQTLTNIWQT